jgi:hypothetical protein
LTCLARVIIEREERQHSVLRMRDGTRRDNCIQENKK